MLLAHPRWGSYGSAWREALALAKPIGALSLRLGVAARAERGGCCGGWLARW